MKIKKISTTLLEKFNNNDVDLALFYAFDSTLLKSNGVRIITPSFEVIGTKIEHDIPTIISIDYNYTIDIKVASILKDKMNISQSKFKKYLDSGTLTYPSKEDLKNVKYKIK